jgi:hypothetical protein
MDLSVKAPELEYVGTYEAMLKPPLETGGPFGTRWIVEVFGGEFRAASGDRGELLTGGGDWIIVGSDGYGRLDVRAQIRMEDGAIIYVQYFGLLEMNEAVMGALENGVATDFDDQYFRTNPRFETSDPKYAWLQQGLFVGQGRVIEGLGVQYNVFRVK